MTKKKKYYAIKEGRKSNLIVDTWKECEELTKGYASKFKSFITKEDAEKYLQGKTIKSTENQIVLSKEDTIKQKIIFKPKKGNKQVSATLNNETYTKFINKCKKFEIEEDKIIINLIKEWIDY